MILFESEISESLLIFRNGSICKRDLSVNNEIIHGLIFSVFEEEGPVPIVTFPNDMDEMQRFTIAMKSISLLMGDQAYQGGVDIESIKYFGILPFPDYKLTSLTYFFLIADEGARGNAKAATFSLLIKESRSSFIYENMKDLSVFFAESAQEINKDSSKPELQSLMDALLEKISTYIQNIKKPIESSRNIKILFTGLDSSGKTSFLRAIKQKYSELTNIRPTKGIERSEEEVLGVSLSEWDIGGQKKYRQNFLKQADLYLYDTNLLIFLIDIRNVDRFSEALKFFNDILEILRSFKQFPPFIICNHKYDPDITSDSTIEMEYKNLKEKFLQNAPEFQLRFVKTSIFNQYSLNKAFSSGINLISPNRDILRGQLQWLSQKTKAMAMILVDNNNIILSDFSINLQSQKISEMAAPHFKNLYKTFNDFKILKQKSATLQMDENLITFNNIHIDHNQIYLLSLLNNRDKPLNILMESIPEFKKRITPLIESYL